MRRPSRVTTTSASTERAEDGADVTGYTGMPSVSVQDRAITWSQGEIVDRSKEALGSTDTMIIRVRRRLLHGGEGAARARHGAAGRGRAGHVSPAVRLVDGATGRRTSGSTCARSARRSRGRAADTANGHGTRANGTSGTNGAVHAAEAREAAPVMMHHLSRRDGTPAADPLERVRGAAGRVRRRCHPDRADRCPRQRATAGGHIDRRARRRRQWRPSPARAAVASATPPGGAMRARSKPAARCAIGIVGDITGWTRSSGRPTTATPSARSTIS